MIPIYLPSRQRTLEIGIAPFAELLRKKVPKGQVAKAATELKFHDLWHFCCFAYFSR